MSKRFALFLLSLLAISWWSRVCWNNHPARRVLFFFRVPKTGSEMTVLLLQWLQGVNNFRHVRLRSTVDHRLDPTELTELMNEVNDVLQNTEHDMSVSFDRHAHFIDFASRGGYEELARARLIYFSSVRDPIDRIVSQYYYARATPRPGGRRPPVPSPHRKIDRNYQTLEDCIERGRPECTYISGDSYSLMIPYFCGHQSFCSELNNVKALQQAQKNVEEYFPVVGMLEHWNCTLQVLEQRLLPFFGGVRTMYFDDLSEPKKNKNYDRPRVLRPDLAAMLRRNLTVEYQFYHFLRRRLLHQCGQPNDAPNL